MNGMRILRRFRSDKPMMTLSSYGHEIYNNEILQSIDINKALNLFITTLNSEKDLNNVNLATTLKVVKDFTVKRSEDVLETEHSEEEYFNDRPIVKDERFKTLIKEIEKSLDTMQFRACISVFYSLSAMGIINEKILDFLISKGIKNAKQLNPQDISQISWSFAKLRISHKALFESLDNTTVAKASSFLSYDTSLTLWAYATLHRRQTSVLEALGTNICNSKHFSPQSLSNISWAYARVSYPNPKVFEKVAVEAIKVKNDLTAQGVSNILWSFGKLDHSTPNSRAMALSFEPVILSKFREYKVSHLVNCLLGFSKLGVVGTSIFPEVTKQIFLKSAANDQLYKIKPISVSDSFWCMGRTLTRNEALMRYLITQVLKSPSSYNHRNLNDILFGMARNGFVCEDVMRLAERSFIENVQDLTVPQIAQISWSLIQIGLPLSPLLIQSFLELIEKKFDSFASHDLLLSYSLWTVANWGPDRNSLLLQFFNKLNTVDMSDLSIESKKWIYESMLLLENNEKMVEGYKLRDEQLNELLSSYIYYGIDVIKSDHLSLEFGTFAQNTLPSFKHIYPTKEGPVLNVALPLQKIAFETSQRSDDIFFHDKDFKKSVIKKTPSYHLRQSLLKKLGWKIVPIPSDVWKSLNEEEKNELMQKLYHVSTKEKTE